MEIKELDRQGILDLCKTRGTCVSLFVTPRAFNGFWDGAAQLKTLLAKAEGAVAERDPDSLRSDWLAPARRLLSDESFWQKRPGNGPLAVFLAPHVFHIFSTPLKFESGARVDGRFHVTPVLELLSAPVDYYVLALSQNHVRLVECDRTHATPVQIKGVPANLHEALAAQEHEPQLQFHVVARSGKRSRVFHGHAAGIDDSKANLLHFCQEIDRALRRTGLKTDAPLIVAAVGEVQSAYREASTYPHLAPEGVPGNPDLVSDEELRLAASTIAQTCLTGQGKRLTHEYTRAGADLTRVEIQSVLYAASSGRVRALFLAKGEQRWGFFRPGQPLESHTKPERGDEELLNLAAVQTLLDGGEVYAMNPSDMPESGTPVAALLRY